MKRDQKQLKSLFHQAKDENTSSAELKKLWFSTTSVKIRKAIASNPNADWEILRIASRLYIEEVLENPGFEMMSLFDSDPWVNDIALAYKSPKEFISKSKINRYSVGFDASQYCKACLLSPEIDANEMNFVLQIISLDALKRCTKNESLKSKIRDKILEQPNMFELESAILAYNVKAIDKADIISYLRKQYRGGISAPKGRYNRFYSSLVSDYLRGENKSEVEDLISLLFYTGRTHMTRWAVRSHNTNSMELLEMYSRVIGKVKKLDYVYQGKIKKSSYLGNIIDSIGEYITTFFKIKYSTLLRASKPSDTKVVAHFKEMFSCAKKNKLLDEEFWVDITIPPLFYNAISSSCTPEEKVFFVSRGMLGNWAIFDSSGKYPIFDSANNALYEMYKDPSKLLFDRCSINKTVTLKTESTSYFLFN